MFDSIMKFLKKMTKKEEQTLKSKDAAKERLHLVLMQDRANVSADFLDLMKQEIIEVIKKYIDIDESAIDVRLTNKENNDGTNGAPALYANIPILNIKDEARKNAKVVQAEPKEETPKKSEKQQDADEVSKKGDNKENKKDNKVKDEKVEEPEKVQSEKEDKKEEVAVEKKEDKKEQTNKKEGKKEK